MSANVITIDEIAAELGVQRVHAARKCRLLAEQAGFPRPLPGLPNRYSRSQVEAWFARGGSPVTIVPAGGASGPANWSPERVSPAGDAIAAAREILEERYVRQ